MTLSQNLTRRDGLLILIGACIVYIVSSLFQYGLSPAFHPVDPSIFPAFNSTHFFSPLADPDLGAGQIPETTVISHAPGWTLFRNLYMANGTMFIVSDHSAKAGFPEIRMMMSTGLLAENNPENIRLREPTDQEMQIISVKEAHSRWGASVQWRERHRISSIEGISLLVNEPWQFLNHYYHFVAELVLGSYAFLYGAFHPSTMLVPDADMFIGSRWAPSFNLLPSQYQPPPLSRVIFLNADTVGWRDKPGFNSYFFRAVFPSTDIEFQEAWKERAISTFVPSTPPNKQIAQKAWHFPMVLLSDRSAAFRGDACGSRTQRIAAEAWEYMMQKKGLDPHGHWWDDIRKSVYRFAGLTVQADDGNIENSSIDNTQTDPQRSLPLPKKVVITYVNRQGVRRHLIPEHHDKLVKSLEQLVLRKKVEGKHWIFNNVKPETLSKDDQVKLASETTIMLGVHGNGLTHLVLMEPNRYSSVIEIFYPGGFARDYEWTTRALGMRHFSVWNDTYFTHPHEPDLAYPDGFQGTSIPVDGPAVAKLIESRLEGTLIIED